VSRAWRAALVAAGIALAGVAGTACPAAHPGAPGRACVERADCFAGEICDTTIQQCVSKPPDLAMPPPDLSSSAAMEDLLPPTEDAQ